MPLNLTDLMKKAELKGIKPVQSPPLLRPWQQESILFTPSKEEEIKNEEQTGNKVVTNRKQSGNKPETNEEQKNKYREQIGNKVVSQPVTLSVTNRKQTGNKVLTNHSFSSLVGLQRAVMIFLFNECKRNRTKVTENLTLEYISSSLKTSTGSVKTTVRRLEAKELINRIEFKNGRGGWSKYSIPELLYQELISLEIDNKPITKWKQTDNKVVSEPVTQPGTSPSSSSNIINNTTTIGYSDFLPEEWERINIEPLFSIGFSKKHLKDIFETKLCTPEVVQESIYHFAFRLENKPKEYPEPLRVFIGCLRKGKVWFEPNYISSTDKALKELVEEKKRQEAQRENLIKEFVDLEFPEWRAALSEEEIKKIVPQEALNSHLKAPVTSSLKTYFIENILKTRLKEQGSKA